MPNITLTRRQNALALFQDFAEKSLAAGTPPKGLEQSFAAKLQISPSMWSQVKSARPIGDKLARQIESLCAKPPGWLDQARKDVAPNAAEAAFLQLALQAWRSTNSAGRKRIHLLLIDDARRGLEDIAAGHTQDADAAIAKLQQRRARTAAKESKKTTSTAKKRG